MVFDDPARTSFTIDPHRGTLVQKMSPGSRLHRILHPGLHSCNFFGFNNQRPLRDVVVGFFMLGGVALSGTGIVVALQWSRRSFLARESGPAPR